MYNRPMAYTSSVESRVENSAQVSSCPVRLCPWWFMKEIYSLDRSENSPISWTHFANDRH